MRPSLALILTAGLALPAAAHAQAPPPPAAMHQTMRPKASSASVPLGQVIGNKRTHVFHVAGDHSALPAPQNRVIFHSTAEAKAAGYHAAGEGTPPANPRMNPERHGSRRTGTTSATGRPMPPHALPGAIHPPPPVPIAPR